MRFFRTVLITLLLSTGGTQLPAQRPQGSDQSFTDIIAYGGGALTLSADGRILQSVDNGETYIELFDHTASLYGIGAGGDTVIAVGKDGVVFVSDFSLDNMIWDEKTTPAMIGDLRAVDTNGSSVWHAVGEAIFRSVNNGQTWNEVTVAGLEHLNDVLYTGTDSNWVAVGEDLIDGQAFYSTDGGVSWSASALPASTPALNALAVDSAGNILAVSEGGSVLLSVDQGATFATLSILVSQPLTGVVSTDENQWLIGGGQRLLLSVNSDSNSSVTVLNEAAIVVEDQANDIALIGDAVIIAGTAEVPAPQISPAQTVSIEPVEVMLIPGMDTEATYYSIDGSEPDGTDAVYTAPFLVSVSLTVNAVSQLDGVFSAVISRDFTITIHTLTINPAGNDIGLQLDTSLMGYNYELQTNTDLVNNGGWTNAGAVTSGTGGPLDWTFPNPAGPLFWRVGITVTPP